MTLKVKRGLGLLVVALIAYVLVSAMRTNPDSTAAAMVGGVAGAIAVVALLGGLVLIAWGLLRD